MYIPCPHIARALIAARKSLNITSPNPRVGCVLVDSNDRIIGEGSTQMAGGPHAEVMALREAAANGQSTEGATAYVTLEPCSHHGQTGPCCNALIDAGIKKVVAAIADPNPIVCGKGFEKLRAAGVEVVIGPGAEESRELNIGFFSRMIRRTPWVRMKIAASLDGSTALENGTSQWITSETARADGQTWRARACAVLTGIGTVRQDNPRLDVRLAGTLRQPHLVIIDSRLETPLAAQLFDLNRQVFIYAAVCNDQRKTALEARGATVIYLPAKGNRVDLIAMLRDLAQRGVNELHVEAGQQLNGSLIQAGLVDEFVVYLAPKLLGQGLGMAHFGPLSDLTQAVALEFKSTDTLGPDLRIVARVRGCDQF
jgi:diaminohydroxyphosphoribosylaminopyrimidine deaminase/5-amino-6-(5-phosphoribosylamino)uracil reductase